MAALIPNTTYDLALTRIQTVDVESVCSQYPNTYYQACRPPMWVGETAYIVGGITRSPTDNNKVYECTVAGTSGVGEPAWGTVNDGTFTDGTVTWKTHPNYSLATTTLSSGEKVLMDKVGGGRQLVIAEKVGVISHRAGTVTHNAFLNSTDKTIEMIMVASTTAPADDEILAGRTTIFHQVSVGLALV